MTVLRIGYVGLTHLGINSAVAAAVRGCDVIGFDPDKELVAELRRGELRLVEPGLFEAMAKHRDRIQFESDMAALVGCDIVYVCPDVATDDQGESDLSTLIGLLDMIEGKLSPTCVEVILSQVPPGFTRSRTGGENLLFCQVETLIFGRALERAMYPERFMIGCNDPVMPFPEKFRRFLELFDCPIMPMRYESAELAKISINCFLVAQVGTTNTLAEICENVGADWTEIAPALHLDARIGPKAYLKPGLGIAGGNLERDLRTIVILGERYATDTRIIQAEIANSAHRKLTAARLLRKVVLPDLVEPVVAVWGLAYKENTHSIKNSPSLATLTEFPEFSFRVHDPVVDLADVKMTNITDFDTPLAALAGADCLMILTPWDEYRHISPTDIVNAMRGTSIIDPYAVLDGEAAKAAGLMHLTLGKPAPPK